MQLHELKKILKINGVVGAGGAGFPSYFKLDQRADTIILNCAECEPLLRLHRQLLAKYTYEIIKTLNILAEAIEADKIIIALKRSYTEAVQATETVISDFKKAEICYLPEVYPAGDEIVTIYEATKRVVAPGNLPISVGVIVYNVETVLNMYNAIINGKPVTHKYVTIGGAVNNPVTVKAPLGVTLKYLVDNYAGGSKISDAVYIKGGPMTGCIANPNDVLTKTTNGILLFEKNHSVVLKKQTKISIDMKRAMASCCQCRMCTDLCPRNLLGHPIEPNAFMRSATSGDVKNLAPFLNTFYCSGCGLCEMYSCPQGLAPRILINEYKINLRKNRVEPLKEPKTEIVNKFRSHRLVPINRLVERLGLAKYESNAPLADIEVTSDNYKVMLLQHIGVPARCMVKSGESVHKGDVLAVVTDDELGAFIHSPSNGKITDITERWILISRKDED